MLKCNSAVHQSCASHIKNILLQTWIFGPERAQISTHLTVGHGRPCRNVFTYIDSHIDELKQQMIQFWRNLDQNVIDIAVNQWCKRF